MAEERSTEVVPGMAEAIEARLQELRLRPGRFAELAGVTLQGLVPIRRGYRRNYQDKVKFGVASALQWPPDAIDRLMDGQAPDPRPPAPADAMSPDEEFGFAALDGKPLTDEEKRAAIAVVRAIRGNG